MLHVFSYNGLRIYYFHKCNRKLKIENLSFLAAIDLKHNIQVRDPSNKLNDVTDISNIMLIRNHKRVLQYVAHN